MISVRDLSFLHGNNLIFDNTGFSVSDNQKVGLVGPNGAGKTTLLKLLMKSEDPNSGKIEVSGTIGFVPQEVKFDLILDNSSTIKEYLDPNHFIDDYKIKKMLEGLELSNLNLKDSPKNLSGGQKTKLALIRAILLEPDILLLDEPTNYLDQSGKIWVANLLKIYPKTLIIISHDLELLDQSIDKVLFINTQFKKIEEYTGNYSKFVKLKQEKESLAKRQILIQQKHIKKMEESIKTLYKNRSEGGVRQRVMLQRRVEKMKQNLPELPAEAQKIKLSLPTPEWVGELPIRAVDISKSYGENSILDKVNFSIRRGERVALIGPNGAGKSTLIKILVGLLQPDLGEILKDEKLNLGYYSQEFETFDLDKTLIEALQENTGLEQRQLRPILAKFLFPGDKVHQRISSLSGGEKTRLSIAMILLHSYNLLILDEPTTYLDPLSQRIILEGLKQSESAMLIVSHTEEFIKELQPSKVLFLPGNSFDVWDDQYLNKVNEA